MIDNRCVVPRVIFREGIMSASKLDGVKSNTITQGGISLRDLLWRRSSGMCHICNNHLGHLTLRGKVNLLPLDIRGLRLSKCMAFE